MYSNCWTCFFKNRKHPFTQVSALELQMTAHNHPHFLVDVQWQPRLYTFSMRVDVRRPLLYDNYVFYRCVGRHTTETRWRPMSEQFSNARNLNKFGLFRISHKWSQLSIQYHCCAGRMIHNSQGDSCFLYCEAFFYNVNIRKLWFSETSELWGSCVFVLLCCFFYVVFVVFFNFYF